MILILFLIYITGVFFGIWFLTLSLAVEEIKTQKEIKTFLKVTLKWPITLPKIIHTYFKSLHSGE
jgi:hypothetical protein